MSPLSPAGTITDVPGVCVGHHTDTAARTGVTVVLFEHGAVGAGVLLGSAVSTRGFESLHPRGIAKPVHGVCFAGGSTFGLTATGGVQQYLREQGRGWRAGNLIIPLVPTAIIFDLHLGKQGVYPTEEMGYLAGKNAGPAANEGNVGAGTGALVGKLLGAANAMAGGVGTVSARVGEVNMGVLAVVNAFGDVRDPATGRVVAGVRRAADSLTLLDATAAIRQSVARPTPTLAGNTTLVLVVTDGALSPIECEVAAKMAAAGFARTIAPIFTQYDGDVIVFLSNGQKSLDLLLAGQLAADLCAEAILRGVRAATPVEGLPCAADLTAAAD